MSTYRHFLIGCQYVIVYMQYSSQEDLLQTPDARYPDFIQQSTAQF
jgi:hypothetical protein